MVEGVLTSLYSGQQLAPLRGAFAGLANYARLIGDPNFWLSLQVTLVYTVACVGVTLIIALGVALLINTDFHGRRIARALIMLPWATPTVAAVLIWSWMFNYEYGVLNAGLRALGISRSGVSWLFSPHVALIAVLMVTIWKIFPFSAVVLLTALQAVDRNLYEAAALDGASRVGLFRYVTLPGIRPTLALLVLLVTIWSFQRFTIIWLLTQGGPIGSTQTIVIMVYNNAFRYIDTGYGAAIGVVGLIMSLFVALMYFVVERRTSLEGAQ
jgi:multiple sugar transport system permease protein